MAEVIRYLPDEEKNRTRALWERIFAEDSERFLDYYYHIKTADNEILVLERDGEILSMLQLNPYRLQLGAAQVEAAYVIAVATDSRYRHQGMMARLLKRAMQDRQAKKQPFLFLMPAAEAIYRPFGFRFIYRQQSMTGVLGVPDDAEPLTPVEDHSPVKAGLPQKPDGWKGSAEAWKLSPVAEDELEAAARFAEDQLSRRHIRVRTIRDRFYYHVLKKECQAENGNLCWMLQDGRRQGLVAYTYEEAVEVREPLLPEPERLEEALNGCFGSFHRPLYVSGIVPGKEQNGVQKAEGKPESGKWKQEPVRPVIMARALDLSVLTAGIRAVCPVSLVLDLEDGILPDNTGCFLWQVSELESCWEKLPAFGESGKAPVLHASVDEFVQLLFPDGDPAASATLLERMTPEVQEVWGKLSVYTNVFLNEIV